MSDPVVFDMGRCREFSGVEMWPEGTSWGNEARKKLAFGSWAGPWFLMGLNLGAGERISQIVAFIYSLSPTEQGDCFHLCFSRDFPLATSLHMNEFKTWAGFYSLLVCSSFEDQSALRTQGVFRESMTGKMKKRNLSLQDTSVHVEVSYRSLGGRSHLLAIGLVSTRTLPGHCTELHIGHPVGLQRSSRSRGH